MRQRICWEVYSTTQLVSVNSHVEEVIVMHVTCFMEKSKAGD